MSVTSAMPPAISATTIELKSGDSVLTLCPDIGAAIVRFSWCGHEILRPAPESAITEHIVRQMACYALVPWSAR